MLTCAGKSRQARAGRGPTFAFGLDPNPLMRASKEIKISVLTCGSPFRRFGRARRKGETWIDVEVSLYRQIGVGHVEGRGKRWA